MKRVMMAVVAAMAGTMMLAGCGSGGGGATGTLQVAITDKMSDDCASVVVTVKEIRAVPAGHEGDKDDSPGLPLIVRFNTPQVIDVMKLQFQAELLGQAVIPAGTYTQLRLILAENPANGKDPVNYLTLNSDTQVPKTHIAIKTPSGQQSGLKVLGRFTVEENKITAMMIDFDPNTAIVDRGNGDYNLKPTGIRLVKMDSMMLANYGSLIGSVVAPAPWNGEAFLEVKRGQTTVASGGVFAHYTSGSYQPAAFSAFVPSGSYKAFLSATGFQTYSSQPKVVTAGSPTDFGSIILQ